MSGLFAFAYPLPKGTKVQPHACYLNAVSFTFAVVECDLQLLLGTEF